MKKAYFKYGSMFVVFLAIFLTYNVIKPFILPLISAAVIAYIFHPFYKFLYKKTKRKNLSAFIMCLFVLVLVVLPFLFLLNSLLSEIPSVYGWISDNIHSSNLLQKEFFERLYTDFGIDIKIDNIIESIATTLLNKIRDVLTAVPSKMINTSIAGFFLFFFFRDGKKIFKKITQYLPFTPKHTALIATNLKNMANAVVYGQLITAILQAVLATLAYSVLGVKAPLFWGIITMFMALIPMIGPSFVYIPLSLAMVGISFVSGNTGGVVKGIVLLAYGFGIISSVDNIVKPFLISDKVSVHPGLVLLGVIGGLTTFGVIGVVLGPLILVFTLTVLSIYEKTMQKL